MRPIRRGARPFVTGTRAALGLAALLGACDGPDRLTAPPADPLPTAAAGVPQPVSLIPAGLTAVDLPAFDEEIESVDLCEAVEGLCGAPACPDLPLVGSASERKGTGWRIAGCAGLTDLRIVSGHASMGGELGFDIEIDPGSLPDAGCVETTITIPGTPGTPAVAAVVNPRTGRVIWPGWPARPGRDPETRTIRVPAGCDPLRDPDPTLTLPSLTGLPVSIDAHASAGIVVEAAGSGRVDLRIPIKQKKGQTLAVSNTGAVTHKITAVAGLYLVIRGELKETVTRFTADLDQGLLASGDLATGGEEIRQTHSEASATAETAAPDTTTLLYGVQPAVSVTMEPFPPPVVAGEQLPGYLIESGVWGLRWIRHTLSANARGTLMNDADTGVEGGAYYRALEIRTDLLRPCPQDPDAVCEPVAPVDTIGEATEIPLACCEADLYDQYGTGQFRFRTATTGEAVDADPDGYRLTWRRTSMEPWPFVDVEKSILLTADDVVQHPKPVLGTVHCTVTGCEPVLDCASVDGCSPWPVLPARAFGAVEANTCQEVYSDAPFELAGEEITTLDPARRIGFGAPGYALVVGCEALPAEYTLTLDELAQNCTVRGENPRVVTLLPLLDLARVAASPGSDWLGVTHVTEVALDVHCRPLVGDVRVSATTRGIDTDPDGYTLAAADAVKGTVRSRVPASGEALLSDLRVGRHTLSVGDVAFNCTLSGAADRPVQVGFETETPVALEVSCAPVYETLCAVVGRMLTAGAITSHGIARSLCARTEAAAAARERGERAAAEGAVRAFENHVRAQSGGHIGLEAAALLLEHAAHIRANGFFMP